MAKRQGKYAQVLPKLQKYPTVEPERRDVVEALKQEILEPPSDVDPTFFQPLGDYLTDAESNIEDVLSMAKRQTAGKRSSGEFARTYAELRKVRDAIAKWDSSVGLLIEAYMALMIEQFEAEGISGLKLENGQPVTTFPEPYAQVTDKEAFRRWCLKQVDADGNQVLASQMALPWQTTNALTKALLLEGLPEPDGVTCFSKTKVRLGSE